MKVDAELLERYRSNNCDLALALNELKSDLDAANKRILEKERELQIIHSENASLRCDLIQRDNQLATWRAMFVDLVQANTRKYTEVMSKIGLVPTANSVNKTTTNQPQHKSSTSIAQTELNTPLKTKQSDTNDRIRARKFSLDASQSRLSNLTEESISSQMNHSDTFTPPSPPKRISNVTRRRVSSFHSPISSPPKKRDNPLMKELADKKANRTPMLQIDEFNDENKSQNMSGRPARRTKPKNLAEPKLGTKMRRN